MKNTSLALTLAAALTLASCGGSSATVTQNGGAQQNEAVTVNGAYRGSYAIQGGPSNIAILGAISSTGFGFFADSSGFLYVLPRFSATGSLSGTLNGFAPAGFTFGNADNTAQFAVTGSAQGQTASSINGSFSGIGETGTFTLSTVPIIKPTVADLAGSYGGYYVGSGYSGLTLAIAADGTVTGSDNRACSISGKITAGSDGIFSFAATSGTGVDCAGQLSGIAFESSTDYFGGGASGTFLYLGAAGEDLAFAAELQKQ